MSEIMVPNSYGELVKASDVAIVDNLIKLKRKHQGDFWPVMDEVVRVFQSRYPTKWKSYVMEMDDTRSNTYNEFGAASKSKTKGTGDIRRTLDIPLFVDAAMRKLYSVEEMPFNKEFYEDVWKRYPMFRVSQKI